MERECAYRWVIHSNEWPACSNLNHFLLEMFFSNYFNPTLAKPFSQKNLTKDTTRCNTSHQYHLLSSLWRSIASPHGQPLYRGHELPECSFCGLRSVHALQSYYALFSRKKIHPDEKTCRRSCLTVSSSNNIQSLLKDCKAGVTNLFETVSYFLCPDLMRRATGLIHTSEIKILLNLPSNILVLICVNVKSLIMLMLFLEQARGRPTWLLADGLVPTGTTLVTPAVKQPFSRMDLSISQRE